MPSFITLGDFNFSKLCSAMRPEVKPWPPTSEGSGVDITIRSAMSGEPPGRSRRRNCRLTGRNTPNRARAEGVFAADVEWQLRLQFAGSVPEEAGEAAKMVIMSMAQHQRVEAGGLNPDELPDCCLPPRGVKPKSIRICLVSSPRWLSTCIESPNSLTSCSARRMIRADAPAKVLDYKAVILAAGGDRELIVLRDDADGDAVKGRDGSRESVCFNLGDAIPRRSVSKRPNAANVSSAGHIAPGRFNAYRRSGSDAITTSTGPLSAALSRHPEASS